MRVLPSGDAGDIVLGWLTRVVVVLALLGVVAFDAISIGTTKVSSTDAATKAAQDASETWLATRNAPRTVVAAQQSAIESNADNTIRPEDVRIDPDGTVHVVVRRTATTTVVRHIGPIRSWAEIASQGSGKSVPGS